MRSAIIGVTGGRARAHADAYRRIDDAELVAVSARTSDAADAFAAGYSGVDPFTDHRQMLDAVRPELVHVSTPPSARLAILRDCDEAGVAAVILEKPVAIDREDLEELAAFERRTRMRVAVNHQLHFHRAMARMKESVGAWAGPIDIYASAGMNAAYQGTHLMQSARDLLSSEVTDVTAEAEGSNGLEPSPAAHYAPDDLEARFHTAAGNIRLHCGVGAPRVPDHRADGIHLHKRVKATSAAGDRFEWNMWSWQCDAEGRRSGGDLDWKTEDAHAQAALTRSVVAWNGVEQHPLELVRALDEYSLILRAYASAADVDDAEAVLPQLRRALQAPSRPDRRLTDVS
ncbi:hypothetical protein GCM10022200_16980 [Microbacterium awajiense]|uniref:Gfo/Idh/MocA-like oxidoreductase N-terminal domain-containing protein n=1 Tax=Microbacterium awajiense TaxID=415214 RepID=A0ABP7AJW3_9MICO